MGMKTINEIRDYSGLSRADFSRVYGIPTRTLQDWEAGKRKCPEYLLELLYRVVVEDNHEAVKCYDKAILRELGACYYQLLLVMNPKGNNPYPYAFIYPTKYFTMLHGQASRIGIPDELSQRIAILMDHIDPDDWTRSMDIPVPTAKQQFFELELSEFGRG